MVVEQHLRKSEWPKTSRKSENERNGSENEKNCSESVPHDWEHQLEDVNMKIK
jgi:hypothetical protein